MRIPVTGKVYSMQDKLAMMECIMSGEEITYGSWNVKFEKMLAEYIGTKYAYFVNSGSSANLLAFMAFTSPEMYPKWRVSPGDEIITVAAGFPTTVAPIVQYGAVPMFVDIDSKTYNVDVTQLDKALSPETKGVFLAHTLGNPFNVRAVKNFCERNNLFLIEDNADAFGSTYGGKRTGSFGTVSTSSFYPAHHLSTGQGGAVFTDDPLIAKIMLSMRNWGKACVCQPNQNNVCGQRFTKQYGQLPEGYDHKYVFSNFGYNLQGTNILASLGCSQMERIEEFTKQRHRNFDRLYSLFEKWDERPFELPVSEYIAVPSWFGFPILLDITIKRDVVMSELARKGIDSRTLFAGNITRQPCFADNQYVGYGMVGRLDETDKVMDRTLWLGCWHGLDSSDMDEIASNLKEVLNDPIVDRWPGIRGAKHPDIISITQPFNTGPNP